jgi:antitoxin component of MazEF toxin-antitoxin module
VPEVRLQKQLSRKVGKKEYPKWVITIPPRQIGKLGWREGEYLESEIKNRVMLIRREDTQKLQRRKEATEKA